MYKSARLLFFSLFLLQLVACKPFVPSFYTPDVRQGNYLDQEKISQLQTGMSKRDVQVLLGTPLLTDPFRSDRWDYVYRFAEDGDLVASRRLSLFFEGELLSRVEDSESPSP